jgi:hypothetical protein
VGIVRARTQATAFFCCHCTSIKHKGIIKEKERETQHRVRTNEQKSRSIELIAVKARWLVKIFPERWDCTVMVGHTAMLTVAHTVQNLHVGRNPWCNKPSMKRNSGNFLTYSICVFC